MQTFIASAIANDSPNALNGSSLKSKVLAIAPNILLLNELSENDAKAAKIALAKLQKADAVLNYAEQYLLHVTKANIASIYGQEHEVIKWLDKATKLSSLLSDEQSSSPSFARAYLTLANAYKQQGEYKKAFEYKKKYIKKYSLYLKSQNELRVKRLNEKYKMAKKHEENKLLEQNNELKRFELARVESQRNQQSINIVIILLAGLLFFFLLLRQFTIRRALRGLAKIDSLTKLANRRSFFATGYRFMEYAIKEQSDLCVLMIDIDNFKQVNDALGHDMGDKVICQVAGLASETMRSRDILARIDGEEFAAILPDANVGQARAIAERIREKITDSNEQTLNNISVTVSIGLASINDANGSFDHLLHIADIAMYQAKANGRNCVCNYSPNCPRNGEE